MLAELNRLQAKADRLWPEEEALFELIAALVEQHDEKHYPLGPTTPLRMLKGFMEARDLKPRDLWQVLGSKSAVSHILSGPREISKAQAKELGEFFGGQYQLFL